MTVAAVLGCKEQILTAQGAADVLSPEVICLKRPYEINFLSFGIAFDHSPASFTSSHAFVYDSMFGKCSECVESERCVKSKSKRRIRCWLLPNSNQTE